MPAFLHLLSIIVIMFCTNNCTISGLPGDPCAANPCKNGGTCLHKDDGYLCQCQADYYGKTCEGKSRLNCVCDLALLD